MTRPPDFEQLVGTDLDFEEHERLLRVHELIVAAGPPPELPPHLERGPTLAMTLRRRSPSRVRRRVLLLAAALVVVALAFLGGYISGNGGGNGLAGGEVLNLRGTQAAPQALASLRIEPRDAAGNWPMRIAATGLPKLPARSYYEVFLVRNGKPWAPCGTFVVGGTDRGVSVALNAPYRLQPGDSWIVTKQLPGTRGAGPVVLQPTA